MTVPPVIPAKAGIQEDKEMRCFAVWLALFLVLGLSGSADAEVPHLINYQGMLTDSVGTLIDGSHNLTFRIYADSSGGAALWTEIHSGVDVEDGLFHVILGVTTPIPGTLFEDPERWIGVTVDPDPEEIAPRMKITSVPWALKAEVADTVLSIPQGSSGPT